MKMQWEKYIGFEINIIMKEYYGAVQTPEMDETFYEIVFKSGILTKVYDDGLLISGEFEKHKFESFIPFESIKCVDIFYPAKK
jgi:hypothetical protein